MKAKLDGPFGCGRDGVLYYLKRQLEFSENGIDLSCNAKCVPKFVEMLHVTERRGKSVPGHHGLQVYDSETISESEFLNTKDAKIFRSGLGVCIYISQDRSDIPPSVRVLASYTAKPTRSAMAGLKKLASYLNYTKEMKIHYPKVELHRNVFTNWKDNDKVVGRKPYQLVFFSDADWASCKTTRRSTSSGIAFLNGCCIYSHSRAQVSIALSSMESEILAATGMLIEGMYLKQILQFLVGDSLCLSCNKSIETKLYLDSASAQAFFSRLGAGRAKHMATRLLWSQQAMRKGWFEISRTATKENVADLNTKILSAERRNYLMKKIGFLFPLWQDPNHHEEPYGQARMVQNVVRAVMAVMMTNLQGCDQGRDLVVTTWTSMWTWFGTISFPMTSFIPLLISLLFVVLTYLVLKVNKFSKELTKHKKKSERQ